VRRRTLLAGLREALGALREAGCRTVYLDGSFVTAKEAPEDFDPRIHQAMGDCLGP
jgi:hypothetical protein